MTRSTEFTGESVGREYLPEQVASQLRSAQINAEIHGLVPEFREMLKGVLKELGSGDGQEN